MGFAVIRSSSCPADAARVLMIAFFGCNWNSDFWQEIIFQSQEFKFLFSRFFSLFSHDITSWYIVVCLKRINWRLYWTNFGKQMYWDLVVFLEFLRKKTSHAISWIFAITILRTSQLVSIRSPRRGEQLTPSRGESN